MDEDDTEATAEKLEKVRYLVVSTKAEPCSNIRVRSFSLTLIAIFLKQIKIQTTLVRLLIRRVSVEGSSSLS